MRPSLVILGIDGRLPPKDIYGPVRMGLGLAGVNIPVALRQDLGDRRAWLKSSLEQGALCSIMVGDGWGIVLKSGPWKLHAMQEAASVERLGCRTPHVLVDGSLCRNA